jgi:hypothetical protein
LLISQLQWEKGYELRGMLEAPVKAMLPQQRTSVAEKIGPSEALLAFFISLEEYITHLKFE